MGARFLRGLLAGFFLVVGALKLAGDAEAVGTFARLGVRQGFRIVVGGAEIAGAIGLLLTPLAAIAALALAALMVGALVAHVFVLGARSAGPALVALACCLAVAWLERRGSGAFRSGKKPRS